MCGCGASVQTPPVPLAGGKKKAPKGKAKKVQPKPKGDKKKPKKH
jgi:hypothetical protein